MKKINNYIYKLRNVMLGIMIFSLLPACEDYLDEKVYNFYSEDYYSSTTRLDMGLQGVYEVFSDLKTYGQYWMVYDADTDITHINGSGIGHVARDLGHYNVYTEHPWLQDSWGLYYKGIDRANFLLAKQGDVVVNDTPEDKARFARLVAEARCLRALAYFDLVRLFGDVPFKTKYSEATDNFNIPRTDRDEIYDFICKEFEEAIPSLPWHDENGTYTGRISKGAAHGLLARIYLFRGGYSLHQDGTMKRASNYTDYYRKAIENADKVITSGKHGLNDSYERVFRNMCEYKLEPVENMYEIQFYNPTGDNAHSSTMGTYNGPPINEKSSYGRANSFIKTHCFFYDTYQTGDLRREVAVANFQIDASDVIKPYNRKQGMNWSPGKWRRNWHAGDPKNVNNTDVNVVLLRYSDVLLMKAEAENEINGVSAALEYINQVKRRAYGKPYLTPDATVDYTTADFADKDALFEEIVAERARELCFEGHRRLDLIRWNRLKKALDDTKTIIDAAIAATLLNNFTFTAANRFTPNKHELYPIPEYEMRETGYIWKQNPGYN